jgi:hypothetical protein
MLRRVQGLRQGETRGACLPDRKKKLKDKLLRLKN